MSESEDIAPVKQEQCEHNLSVNIRLWHKCYMDLKKIFIIHMFMRRLDVSGVKTTGAFDTCPHSIYLYSFIYLDILFYIFVMHHISTDDVVSPFLFHFVDLNISGKSAER